MVECACIIGYLVPSLTGSCPPEGLADVGLAAGYPGQEGGRLRGGQAGTVWGGGEVSMGKKFTIFRLTNKSLFYS